MWRLPCCQWKSLLCRFLHSNSCRPGPVLVLGSVNADTIIEVERFPLPGETLTTPNPQTGRTVPGGKGANQAVAAAKLLAGTGRQTKFAGQFGDDVHHTALEAALRSNGVDLTHCRQVPQPSGQGFVFLRADGTVASIVVGGANATWAAGAIPSGLLEGASILLLQREVPEAVNEAVIEAAAAAGVPVILDMGGEDRPLADKLLPKIAYISMNETELERLAGCAATDNVQTVAAMAELQRRGARNVLVTRGAAGALLLAEGGRLVAQEALPVPGGRVVDATGAGDSFRAAFAVAMVEGHPLEQCLKFAAAAASIAVSRMGAIPSLPGRDECEALSGLSPATHASTVHFPPDAAPADAAPSSTDCPLAFASRLNSMADRPELWGGPHDVLGWVARQGTIRGLGLVDFNYPQHLASYRPAQVRAALAAANLQAGAICLRYPKTLRLGAFTNPDPKLRRQGIDLTLEAGQWARDLGASELIIWSAYDGYDYSFQVDYQTAWSRIVTAFQEVCDKFPDLKVSLEFKPTDEQTRFFIVPSTGAAMLLVSQIGRPNMGLTIDFGHCLMAGENPAQSIALAGTHQKLFGLQLNDGYGRLGAEDGLMAGSVHPHFLTEVALWLQRTAYTGHVYFDTFPRNEDPVREAEYNIRRFRAAWRRAARLQAAGLGQHWARHDALGALELMERLEGEHY